MAYERKDVIESAPANADLTTKQYYLCVLNSGGSVAVSGAGAAYAAPLLNKPDTGEPASRGVLGDYPCLAGTTIAINDRIASDANGMAVPFTQIMDTAGTLAGTITGSFVIGYAQGAASAGEYFTLRMLPTGGNVA